MATAAQRLERGRDVSELPKCTIRIGRTESPGTAKIGKLALEGFNIKREMDALKARLAEINGNLLKRIDRHFAADVGTVNVLYDGIKAKCEKKDQVGIDPASIEHLEIVLGSDRFETLVRAKTTYSPERKLVELASDGDNPDASDIRECLTVKERTAVTYSMQ